MNQIAILLGAIPGNEGNRVLDYKEATGLPDNSMERYIKQLKDGVLVEFSGEAAHTGDLLNKNELKNGLQIGTSDAS